MPLHTSLPYRVRTQLFSQLAALEKAGLSAERAWNLLKLPDVLPARVQSVHKAIAGGKDLALAAQRVQLFSPCEATIVRAALAAGSPAPAYERLAASCSQRAQNQGKMRSRMVFPAAILLLALLIQPLPQLFTGSMHLGGYLWQVLWPLFVLAGVFFLAKSILASSHFSSALLQLPIFGPVIARQNALNFFESLALLLEAGVSMFEALPTAAATIDHPDIRKSYDKIKPAMQQGAPFSTALTKEITAPMHLGSPNVVEFSLTGEASGTLPEMLFRHVQMERAALTLFWQQVAEWAPRIAYAAVACWMIFGLLTGAGFGPKPLPPL